MQGKMYTWKRGIGSRLRRVRVAFYCIVATLGLPSATAAEESRVWDAYYTQAQAERGEELFNKNCLHCHAAGPAAESVEWQIGFRLGSSYMSMGRSGMVPLDTTKYPNVYYLFARLRESMPGWGAETVSLQEKADIIAYVLAENDYPVGTRELTPRVPRMKTMWLVEPGFEPLFNGRDLTGWKFVMGPNCRLPPEGCAKPDPGTTFRVERGELIADGKIQGYAHTEEKYRDFTLRLQFRWVVPSDWTGEEDGVPWWGDGGILLFLGDDHVVWPRHMQMQMTVHDMMRPVLIDGEGTTNWDSVALDSLRPPLRMWNSVEIVSQDGVVTTSLNGIEVASVRDHDFKAAGHIGFESEGSEMHFRNIRIKAE